MERAVIGCGICILWGTASAYQLARNAKVLLQWLYALEAMRVHSTCARETPKQVFLAGAGHAAVLEKIAKTDKYEIVLLGISYDGSFERSGLDKYENIHFLGKKAYDILPSYAAHFDVCMIPFVISDLTASTSPVKLFEYMAAEKPIVTTDLAECKKYKSVMCAKNHEDFIALLEEALFLSTDAEHKSKLKEEALANTWESKCKDILNFASAD